MLPVFLPFALVAPAPGPPLPEAVEVRRGTWILKGCPGIDCIEAMKRERITHVISICRDGDAGFSADDEYRALSDAGILFSRVSLKRAPTRDDFEMFRMIRSSLPWDARVVVHCTDGNRAAAVVVGWLAAEGHVKRADALALARQSGLVHPETEQSLLDYLATLPIKSKR